jgi:undecaprenyl pyrophosphate phosphatase UppP
MFEDLSEKQLIVLYVIIALIVTAVLGVIHYYTYRGFFSNPYVIIIVANVEFFCIFYVLYLPLKIKRARERQEENK